MHKSLSEIFSTLKNRNHIVISVETQKAFDKVQHPFTIKAQKKKRIEGIYLYIIIKTMYHKPTSNIILSEEILRTFYLRSEIRQGYYPLSPFSQYHF